MGAAAKADGPDLESGARDSVAGEEQAPLLAGHREGDGHERSQSHPPGLFGGLLRLVGFDGGKSSSNNGKGDPQRSQRNLSVLQKDESFSVHRTALIKQWKTNIKNKLPLSPNGATDHGSAKLQASHSNDVRERGYNLQDDVFLHRQQRGKLAGVEAIDSKEGRQWAAAGLEGTVVRR